MPTLHPGLTIGAMLVVAMGTAIYYYFRNSNQFLYNEPVQAEIPLPDIPTRGHHLRLRRRNANRESNCSICLDNLSTSRTRTLTCKHIFHDHCINMWIRNYQHTCPICRQPV